LPPGGKRGESAAGRLGRICGRTYGPRRCPQPSRPAAAVGRGAAAEARVLGPGRLGRRCPEAWIRRFTSRASSGSA